MACLVGVLKPLTFSYLRTACARRTGAAAEYDIASLFMVSFYCFVTIARARRSGAAANLSVERRRRERRALLAGAAGELACSSRNL